VRRKSWFAVAALALAVWPGLGIARQAEPTTRTKDSARDVESGRGGRGSFQVAQLNRVKEQLGASDDEWKVLEPRVQKVQELQRESNSRPSGGAGGGRGRRRGASATPVETTSSPVQQAARELRESLSSKEAKSDNIKSKLEALREARSKSQADLSKAQDHLREVLTARQEALLVMSGLLN